MSWTAMVSSGRIEVVQTTSDFRVSTTIGGGGAGGVTGEKKNSGGPRIWTSYLQGCGSDTIVSLRRGRGCGAARVGELGRVGVPARA